MMRTGALLLLLCAALGVVAQYPYTRTVEVRSGQQRPAITTVVQDAQGLLWVGGDLGLFRTDGENVDLILRTETGGVTALATDGDAVLAALGAGQVVRCTALGCDTLLNDPLLARAEVRALAVDGNGRIWLATYGAGVWVKDDQGVRWITNGQGLPDDHVNDLCRLPDGRLVAATDQGLAVCTGTAVVEVFGEAHGAPDNLVLSVAVDAEGNVWAGTDRRGAFRWRPGAGAAHVLDPQWADGPVGSIAVEDDHVWLGTRSRGAVMHDLGVKGGSYRAPGTPGDERANAALDLLCDADGAVWWCNGTERLHRADPAVLLVPEHEGVDLRRITALCIAPDDRIWFATPEGLFAHPAAFSERSFITKVPLATPANTPTVSLAAGEDGTVWAATFGNGVYSIAPGGGTTHHTQQDGLANDNVLTVRTGGGRTWFATLDGLSAYGPGARWERIKVPGPGFVYDVLPLADGRTIAATDGNGVLEVGRTEAPRSLAPEGPRTFYALIGTGSGNVWAAGPGTGLCRVAGGAPSCAGSDRPPFNGNLFAIAGALGRVIAFGSTGTSAYDPVTGTWTDLTQRLGLEGIEAELNAVCTEKDGTVWFACDKGLVRIRPVDRQFDPSIRAIITGALLGNRAVPDTASIHVPADRNDLTIRFTGLNWTEPGAVRFEYRLLGHDDRTVRTRDRQASWYGLPPGRYTFQVRAFTAEAIGRAEEHAVPDDWTSLTVTIDPPWWRLPWVIAGAAIVLAGGVFLVLRTRDRRLHYRERLEQEKVRFQLEALRSQVDPHFLFNSFNTLVELIESDTDKAVEHVEQLSTFFRNILQVRDKELIPLAEELDLLRTYFELEQRRFGDRITLALEVDEEALHRCIVPLTTQLLVENALKHNTITAQHPLTITLRASGDDLAVANRMNARLSAPRSTGFGLESIRKRYLALTERPVVVEQRDAHFIVRIPLIDRRP